MRFFSAAADEARAAMATVAVAVTVAATVAVLDAKKLHRTVLLSCSPLDAPMLQASSTSSPNWRPPTRGEGLLGKDAAAVAALQCTVTQHVPRGYGCLLFNAASCCKLVLLILAHRLTNGVRPQRRRILRDVGSGELTKTR